MRPPVKVSPHHARRYDLGKRFRAHQAAALVQGIAMATVYPAPFAVTSDVSHSGLDDSPPGRRRQIT